MPFSKRVKRELLEKCLRLCCVCLDHCATDIEICHIIDESQDGPSTPANGIPACYKCHARIGHYRKTHPRGNRYSPEELRNLRKRVFDLVESGALHAIIVAARIRDRGGLKITEDDLKPPPLLPEAKALYKAVIAGNCDAITSGKLGMLDGLQRSLLIDRLIGEAAMPSVVETLLAISSAEVLSPMERKLVVSRTARKIAFSGSHMATAVLLRDITPKAFARLPEKTRIAIIETAVAAIEADQFGVVNELVPGLERLIDAVPDALRQSLISALIAHTRSSARQGAPAAKRILDKLDAEMCAAAAIAVNREVLFWRGDEEAVKKLVKRIQQLSPDSLNDMHEDYLAMTRREFRDKYDDE